MSNPLHDLPFEDIVKAWDEFDEGGTNIAGIRALCLNDLYYLLVKVCGRVDLLHPWSYERCREVEAEPNGYLDLWGREHGKSSIITFGLTLQNILQDPEITIGIFSENYSLAQKFLSQIKKEFESNKILLAAFPDIIWTNPQVESPKWNEDSITVRRKGNPKEPTIECQGLLSLKTGAHYKLLIYDDVITVNSVTSTETVQKINSYLELSLSQSQQGGHKRFIGTRYSHADSYQHIIDRGIATPRVYPATDDGGPNGKPVLFTEEYWEQKKRENSTFNLSCQYLQSPSAADQKVFDISKLCAYEVRPYKLNVAIVVDPAKSMKKGSAETAILVIGIGANKRKYLLDGACHHMTLSQRWETLKLLHYKWRRDPGVGNLQVGYEVYGSGQVDLDYFQEQMRKEQAGRFIIKPLTSALNGSNRKGDRIERIQPDINYSNIFVPYPTDQKALTKSQLGAIKEGCDYRISRPIKKVNHLKQVYDLTELFINELDNYPFGRLVDCLDAFSRIYDMDMAAPQHAQRSASLSEDELL